MVTAALYRIDKTMPETKTCHECNRTKPITSFPYEHNYHRNTCKDCMAFHRREYYHAHKQHCLELNKHYRHTHKERVALYRHRTAQRIKTKVLTFYGNGKCACVACGFPDVRALSIDHINGNGHTHRNSTELNKYASFYRWILANNYPPGYQTLCMNCQFIKRETNREIGNGNGIIKNTKPR